MQTRSLLPLALAATLAGAWACGHDATAPATTLGEVTAPAANHRFGQAAYVKCDHHPAALGGAWVGPRGGRITAGDVTLVVPAGALVRPVFISARVPEGSTRYVEFQPHGLEFRRPAGLYLGSEGCQIPRDPDVLYVNRYGRVLERIDARYIPYLQIFAAPIDHFSGYVLAW